MGKPAARLGDNTTHGSPLLGAACTTVLIGGQPAWRVGDQHTCPIPNAPPPAGPGTPHGPGVTTMIPDGPGICMIGGKPAARMGDMVTEPGAVVPLPPPNPIVKGCPTVLIANLSPAPAAPNPDLCQTEGDPVDVATGRMFTWATDLERLGPTVLAFKRYYGSDLKAAGALGRGWRHMYEVQLRDTETGIVLEDEYGATTHLKRPEEDPAYTGAIRVEKTPDGYLVWRGPEDGLGFSRSKPGEYLLTSMHEQGGKSLDLIYAGDVLILVRDRVYRSFELRYQHGRINGLIELSSVSNKQRIVAQYEYDSAGRLVAVYDAGNLPLRYEYSEGH